MALLPGSATGKGDPTMSIVSYPSTLHKPSIATLLPGPSFPNKNGQETACPFCGGNHRFCCFTTGYGACRNCRWSGDSLQLLMDRDRLTFTEACQRLGTSSTRFAYQEKKGRKKRDDPQARFQR